MKDVDVNFTVRRCIKLIFKSERIRLPSEAFNNIEKVSHQKSI